MLSLATQISMLATPDSRLSLKSADNRHHHERGRGRLTHRTQFVQSLSNPYYLQYLAAEKYLDNEEFIAYLEYLQYFKETKYLKYLQCVTEPGSPVY